MTVEQFLKSLSELMWASYWSVVFYKWFKSKKQGGRKMRPNRYPYTRNQWYKEVSLVHTSDNRCFKLVQEHNYVTGENR